MNQIEEPRSKLRGMFCRAAVLRIDRKEFCLILIRSLTPQHAKHCRMAEPTGNALAISVQIFKTSPQALKPKGYFGSFEHSIFEFSAFIALQFQDISI
jgi:hypothetical protein